MNEPSEDAFENLGEGEPQRVLLIPGEYLGRYIRWKETQTPWGPKLDVYWNVFLSGAEKKYVQLRRHYNLPTDKKNAKWIFGDGHDYRKDWIRANRGRLPYSRTRLPIGKFREGIMVLFIETVTRDGRRPLPPSSYYSKVGFIVRPFEEDEELARRSAEFDE
jgi:hypothetical protein